jgi:hypothetical protein
MGGIAAIQGVDETLNQLSTAAVAGLTPLPGVTIGPLDRDDDHLRVNWFLYRIEPNPAYANMEPPRTGWRTARGRPPLALQLHYLLSAHSATLTAEGDQDQFAHLALGAVMQAVHEHGVIAEGSPLLSPLALPLVEPLRITMAPLDLESITKVWTAATKPLRLTVGYEISLVIIDALGSHASGPPVQTRRVAVAPTMGPRFVAVTPSRVSAGAPFVATVQGLTSSADFTLARELTDPPGPATGWALAATPAGPDHVTLTLAPAQADLAPGDRRVHVDEAESGLSLGADDIGVVLVPTITAAPTTAAQGSTVTLATAHAQPGVEVFLAGRAVPAADVHFMSPTKVQVTIPPLAPLGPATLALRAATIPGPAVMVTVTP